MKSNKNIRKENEDMMKYNKIYKSENKDVCARFR